MASGFEVVLTSESSGQLWNTCVWDVDSGTQLATFKGGSSTHKAMCLLKQDYLLSAVTNKPIIHVWSLQRREQIQQRIVCAGPVSAMASSADGLYVVAAIQEKLHVWQVCTGNLLSVLHKHYQTVKCLTFTDDGAHFISAGEDNLVLVWTLWKVIQVTANNGSVECEPRHVWSQHSLPVTDVHAGMAGIKCRVFTASLDQTCKVWDLASGQLLLNLVFDCGLTAVTVNSGESRLYAGALNGHIHTVNLHEQPARTELHISSDSADHQCAKVMQGHSKEVSCLCLSMDGSTLFSGSHDHSVRVWNVHSGQCTKTIPHKGVVTNVLISRTPPGVVDGDYKPTLPLQPFKRFLYNSEQGVSQHGEDSGSVCVRLIDSAGIDLEEITENFIQSLQQRGQKDEMEETSQESQYRLQKEVEKLRTINKEMYDFTVKNILYKEQGT